MGYELLSWTKEDIAEAKANGIPYRTFYNRVYYHGIDVQTAKTKRIVRSKVFDEYKELCDQNGITYELFMDRRRRMSDLEAATRPKAEPGKGRPRKISLEIKKLAEENGISYNCLKQRIGKLKMDHYRAATEPLQTTPKRKRIRP